jgi:hypothetical protein
MGEWVRGRVGEWESGRVGEWEMDFGSWILDGRGRGREASGGGR